MMFLLVVISVALGLCGLSSAAPAVLSLAGRHDDFCSITTIYVTASEVSPVPEASNDDIHITVTHTRSDYFTAVTTIPTTNVVDTLTAPMPTGTSVPEVSNDDIHITITHTHSNYFTAVTTIPTTNVVDTLIVPMPTGNHQDESTTPELTTTHTRTRTGYVTITLSLVESQGTSSTSTNDAVAASAVTRFLHDGFPPVDASKVLVPEITSIFSNPTVASLAAMNFQAIPESDDDSVVVETRLVSPMESMETTSTSVSPGASNLPLAGDQTATRFIFHPSPPLTESFMSSTEVEATTTLRSTIFVTDLLTTTVVLPGYSFTSSFQSQGTGVPSSYSQSANSTLENNGAATSGLNSAGTSTSSATTHAVSADFSPSASPQNSSLAFPSLTSVVKSTSELDMYTSYTFASLSTLVAHPGFTSLPSSDGVVSTANIGPLMTSASTSASQQIPGNNFSHTTTELSSSSGLPGLKSYTLYMD